jgi:hypothetical protein
LIVLQDKARSAASTYAQLLEERRQRATRLHSKNKDALGTTQAAIEQRQRDQAQKLQEQQETATQRRRLLQDLERERLKQEHELVLARLNMSREQELLRKEQRRRLDERMETAERARCEQLTMRSSR